MSCNKILKLEDMKNLSADEIVKLYKDGYRIETMQYSTYCTGSSSQDRYITDASSNSANLNIYTAFAQKIMPSNRCLKDITLKLTNVANDTNIYVELRPNNMSTGFPQGNPQSSGALILGSGLNHYEVPYTSLPVNTPTDVTIPLNILLSDTDVSNGIWVVVSLHIFDPTQSDSTVHAKVGNGVSGTPSEHMAFMDDGLGWQGSNTWNLYFKTDKQTYSAPLTTITISPASASIGEGATQQLTATCNITCPSLSWTTSNPNAATVSGTGLVTGQYAGTANITASASGITSNTSVITVTPVLGNISIGPPATINVGSTQQLTATCTDIRSASMTCPTLTWTSSNPAIATVNSSGFVTGVAPGTTNITASVSGKTSNTVSIIVKTLGSIAINPTSGSYGIGVTQQYTATCTDTTGGSMACPTLTWASSNSSVATINSSGLLTCVSPGTANITASASGKTSNISLVTVRTITTLGSISVYPATSTIVVNGTKQFTAVCKDQSGTTMTCPALTWTSSNPSIATIDSNGLATGIATGVTNITASSQGVTSSSSTIAVSSGATSTSSSFIIIGIAIAGIALMGLLSKRK